MIDRIQQADPDAILALYWLAGFVTFALLAWAVSEVKTRKRNRYTRLPSPRKDDRSSIEYSRPHMPERRK